MFENNLTSIKNVEIFPTISLILFIILFVGVVIWVFRMKKDFVQHMENLPLVNDNEKFNNGE